MVQVGFRDKVRGAAPSGWVTVAIAEDMAKAGHQAAFVYRACEHPDGGYPDRVRIRAEEQLRDDEGDPAVTAAYDSFRTYTELASASGRAPTRRATARGAGHDELTDWSAHGATGSRSA
jgi:hypothetical protein